jgi:hypothetical protein
VWRRVFWYVSTNVSVASTLGVITRGILLKAAKPHWNTGRYVSIYMASYSKRRKILISMADGTSDIHPGSRYNKISTMGEPHGPNFDLDKRLSCFICSFFV